MITADPLARANPPTEMERRVAATQATQDEWLGVKLDWKAKKHCGSMFLSHVRRMGIKINTAKAGS
jgi:hypothetical protein